MNQERLLKVILAPHVSEKATLLAESKNQVVFKVASDASKPEIKKAVETLFDVKVASVGISNVKGKEKRFGKFVGRRKNWKKAYVSLEQGFEIDLAGGE